MSPLAVLRDDGPVARRVGVLLSAGAPGPFAWLLPPLVRAVEYGGLIAITALADEGALPACFGLLGVLAFHHYDLLYRLRSGRPLPPAWVGAIGGGWEVRLAVAAALAASGVLGPGLVVASASLGLAYVSESAAAWGRAKRLGAASSADGAAADPLE